MSDEPHPVRTLADLEAGTPPGANLALLGHPVAHSLSPAMHNAALAQMAGEDPRLHGWRYDRFDIEPGGLQRALSLLHARGYAGINLTVPHKETGLSLAEDADAFARAAGAANTLVRTATGWHAANTDGPGLSAALRHELGLELHGRPVILLGAGGAARAAAAQCLSEGVSSLWIGNRGAARLAALLGHLRPLAGGIPMDGFALDDPPTTLPVNAVVINSTSLGLHGEADGPIDLRRLPRPAGVFDMIYNPPATALLRQAAGLGLPHANGLAMLVNQGAQALSLWTGRSAPAAVMDRAARAALATYSTR